MSTTELVTFQISTRDFKAFEVEFAKLAKKATKLGVFPPSFEVVERDRVIPARNIITETGARALIPAKVVHVVSVSGQAPKLAGWTFVAALQHEPAGNIVRAIPGVDVQVRRDLRTVGPDCEHCQVSRRRNDTFVVAHDDGRQVQVGRTCLGDFLGTDSPESIARWAELLSSFKTRVESLGEQGEGVGAGGIRFATLSAFLGFVCASIRQGGWVSRSKARETSPPVMATADHAWNFGLFPSPLAPASSRLHAEEQDHVRAAAALEIAQKHFESNDVNALPDYEHNLRIVFEGGSVDSRSAGIAASLIQFAERLAFQAVESRRNARSSHVGQIGKRETFTLTVELVKDINTQYGASHLHKMIDAAGNVMTWFSSSERLEAGKTYTIKGTVKQHNEFKGVKETVLNRCVVQD